MLSNAACRLAQSWEERKVGAQISALTAPSWSPCGNLVACGSASGAVNIWDIRAARRDAGGVSSPVESFAAHGSRVMECCWLNPSVLLTMSTNSEFGLTAAR